MDMFDMDPEACIEISAKTGAGVDAVLSAIINKLPPPEPFVAKKGLWCFDADVGSHAGNRFFVRNVGSEAVSRGNSIKTAMNSKTYSIKEAGICKPEPEAADSLAPGQIGYIITPCQNPAALLGKTLIEPGVILEKEYQTISILKPSVFSSIFAESSQKQNLLGKSIQNFCLNDPVVTVQPCSSASFGNGFKVLYFFLFLYLL